MFMSRCRPRVSCLLNSISFLLTPVSCLLTPVSFFLTPVSFLLALVVSSAGEPMRSPVVVKIQDDAPIVIEAGASGPLDPVQRVRFAAQQQLGLSISGEQGQTLHLSHFPALNVDGQFISPMN